MRALPYLLVGSMFLPMIIWFVINNLVIKSSGSAFSTSDLAVLGSLACVMVVTFFLFSTWVDKFVQRTRG